MDRFIWCNDSIVRLSEAKISALSPAAQFGASVFEGIRCYWNEEKSQLYAFRLYDHYKRLLDSIKLFQMDNHYTIEDFEKAFFSVIKYNGYREDIAVRQAVFIDGDSGTWSSTGPVNMFVSPIPKQRKILSKATGVKCHLSSWQRISDNVLPPRMKCGANYINSRLAQKEAEKCGYDVALFLNSNGFLAEGPGACVFLIKKNVLITPLLSDSILESITRDTILTVAKDVLHLSIQEKNITRTELYTADEAFLCGSAAEITPIHEVDGFILGNGYTGTLTQQLSDVYLNVVSGQLDTYENWCAGVY